MKIKEFLTNKIIRKRSAWSVISDVVFFVLILMFLIPGTRSILLSGVASVRTLISGPGNASTTKAPLSPESWSWRLTGPDGETISFSDLKGEVIFLNQWATWCPPCRAEMPSIEKLYLKYGSQVKFVILTSEDPQKVKEFIDKHGYTFPVYYGSVAGTELASRSIPTTSIINRSGVVVVNKSGAYNWNARKIRNLITRMLPK